MYLINAAVPNQIFSKSVSEVGRRALGPVTAFNFYLLAWHASFPLVTW